MSEDNVRVPEFTVTKVNDDVKSFVKKIELDYVTDGPDMFCVHFVNQTTEDQYTPVFTHSSGKHAGVFNEGDEISIKLGYEPGGQQHMMKGEITSTEAQFREHDPAMFTIRGFDKLHRLSRGREQRTFENVKDSDIASTIAGELGLGADVDDSGKVHDHVFQNNLSNIDFLYARARIINFEVDVEDDTLLFKRPRITGGGVHTLTWQENVKRCRFYLSTARQVSEVMTRGWSVKDKKEIIGKAANGDELSKMAGQKYGGEMASPKFGKGGKILTVVCNHPFQTQEEADAYAKARLNELAMDFLSGEAVVEGETSIKAGCIVEMKEFGHKYDGLYYVSRAIHTLKPGSGPGTGYTTRIQFKRTGVNEV